jgi:hypothetical protein
MADSRRSECAEGMEIESRTIAVPANGYSDLPAREPGRLLTIAVNELSHHHNHETVERGLVPENIQWGTAYLAGSDDANATKTIVVMKRAGTSKIE